jgi:CheY-like chemotaxis protein
VLSLGGVLRTLDGLVRRLVGADIELEIREGSDIGAVRMDAGQLEQVIVNLVLNARDAMPAGGTLRIATAERQVTGGTGTRHLRPGRYVVLIVSDTGSALDPEALNEVFDSTSLPPHAPRAGLGLSIVYGIVRRCGGAVRISSEPGQGTTVKVYLPRVEPDVQELEAGPAEELRGTETVLVAEDEDGVRELLRKVLTEHGHTVLEARHGRDALMLAERYERPIHLLVTDVVMPEMGGPELAQRLVDRRPDLQVLYVSGYTNDEVLRRGIPEVGAAFVQKPFAPEDLMRRVREVLDTASRVT